MKKFLSLVLLILLSTITGCDFSKPQLEIFIASDMHILSNDLVSDTNQVYTKKTLTSDGRVQEYDIELFKEFINQINEEKPNYVFLTGDLTFNGERQSHIDVIEMLDSINDFTKVLVIPGNHDINNLNPRSFIDDNVNKVDTIDENEFKNLYKDYGYQGALYYDAYSLSYIYQLDENTWALMIDSNNSEYNEEYGTNFVGGFIEANTLSWLKEKLTIAKQNNIKVISATHHNLLVHNELFKTSYTIYNYKELLSIYKEYDVKVNFSGHLHIQSIKQDDNIYDIASGGMLDYGNRYGIFKMYENKYKYETEKLDISNKGFDFEEYSFDTFYNEYYSKSIKKNEKRYGDSAEKITDLLSKINAYYFDGNYKKIRKLVKRNKKNIELINGSNDKYAKSLINVENKDQNKIVIKMK